MRNMIDKLVGAAVAVIIDYVIYVFVTTTAVTNPGYAQYGWGLFIAYNIGLALYLRKILWSSN